MKSSRKPFVIPVFLPHAGCPHRCVFCNQTAITGAGERTLSAVELRRHIDAFLGFKGRLRDTVQIAFYGGNFLGLERPQIISLLDQATTYVRTGEVDSLRCSTRPDTITGGTLDTIAGYPVSTVELGVQSMDDDVLALCRRGHTSRDTITAVARLKARGIRIGLQIMVGLPGDDRTGCLETARRVADLGPDFVRIYPTVVLKNSLLTQWYRQGKFEPLGLEQSVTLVKKLYLYFRKNRIPVIRMGLAPSDDFDTASEIVAGPFHPAFGHLVHSEIFLDRVIAVMESKKSTPDKLLIHVHPRSLSRLRGLRNRNIQLLKTRFHIRSIEVVPDPDLGGEDIRVEAWQNSKSQFSNHKQITNSNDQNPKRQTGL